MNAKTNAKTKRPKAATRSNAAPARGGQAALYAGSFDPMTLGHLDIIERAARFFDRLIVGVGAAAGKKPLLSAAERVALIKAVCAHVPNLEVASFSCLAVDFAAQRGASTLVRGIRSQADYTYETQMAHMNRALRPELETVFLPTSPQYSHISSSLAKEIGSHGGDLSLLLPPLVSARLSDYLGR
jgi:pantetheine-phosphate adenylyltransferase